MTKRSHYETLGVKPDASPAELKRARRLRAEQVHPDKQGGSEEEMAQVNHAFDVLNDPTRRLLYDSTGQDQPPEENRVQGLVMQAFLQSLSKDAPNVVKGAQQFLEESKRNIQQQKQEGQRALDSLKARRDKVSTKAPVNAFHLIVDQHIVQIQQKLAGMDLDIEMCDKAMKKLKAYKSDEKVVQVYGSIQMWGGTASTGGNW